MIRLQLRRRQFKERHFRDSLIRDLFECERALLLVWVLTLNMFLQIGPLVKSVVTHMARKRFKFVMYHSKMSGITSYSSEGFLTVRAVFS